MTKEEKQADERQLLIEVSVRYFLEGMTQSQIAKELFLSRPKVSRLLKKAKETGVVNININLIIKVYLCTFRSKCYIMYTTFITDYFIFIFLFNLFLIYQCFYFL